MKRGMTLIEVLVATTLLASVMGVVGGWTLQQARLTERVRQQAERQRATLAIRELLRDDLLQALNRTPSDGEPISDRQRMTFFSLHRAPGDGGVAGARLLWWFDPERQTLLRQRGDGPERVILAGLRTAHIDQTKISTTLHLDYGDDAPTTITVMTP